MPTLTYPRSDTQLPGTGTEPGINRFGNYLPNLTDPGPQDERQCRTERYDSILTPGQLGQSTVDRPTSPVRSKPVGFTSTKVPKFGGVTSWDQYRQIFDAIAQSNGWDDATVALQLLSHLEGDVFNMALLIPEAKRATRAGQIGALTEHYGSPGQLADNRCQFERTARKDGENLSIFAKALQMLAVKVFGDMGPNAQLCPICDRFVAGHDNCVLQRHLDNVPGHC